MMAQIRAGVGRVTITPPVGMYLVGMERDQVCTGLRDDLFATALVLSDGATEAAIVACDLLTVHAHLVRRVRQEVSARTGIPPAHVMLCATHCHSGPVTSADENSKPLFRAYVDNLAFLLAGAVEMAWRRLTPAQFGFGRGAANIGINRRFTRADGVTVIDGNPAGPVDPEVAVWRVDGDNGLPLLTFVNYACHPVVLGNGSNVISADWPGAMRRTVEQVTGAPCALIQGAGADINPLPGVPTDDERLLEKLGLIIGAEVLRVWAGTECAPAEGLAIAGERLLLPLLPPSQYEGKLPAFVELAGAMEGLDWDAVQASMNAIEPSPADIVGEGDNRRVAMEIQAIAAGDTAVVGAAAEVFVQTGLAVKQRSPIPNTMFAAYANGTVGYLPLPEEYPRGGYEVAESWVGYRLPAPIAPEAAGMTRDAALELLQSLPRP
ncbi:MAG: neutral/alkaline non-lysosomal ceramidase N-terminal domain-containing protein [Anaerolineae bacterium]